MNAITSFPEFTRRDGWTPELRGRFLALLAELGNVRVCAARCGRSAQSAYVQRRRDPVFAQGWAAALLLARDHAEQVLAERAIEGVEEVIFYRGEEVGSRRRYDTRLLLAHLGRLDRLAESRGAQAGAAHFDELVAVVAGEALPEMIEPDREGPWPRPRELFVGDAIAAARDAAFAAFDEESETPEWDREIGEDGPSGEEDEEEDGELSQAEFDAARAQAEAAWDGWTDRARTRVDGLTGSGDGPERGESEQPPLEFKSLDPVNRVNFARIRPIFDEGIQSRGMRFQASSAAIL